MAAKKKKKSKKRDIKDDIRVSASGAVEIDLPTNEITQAFKPEKKSYWMGSFPFCPRQNPTMYGFAFARFTGTPTFDPKGRPDKPLEWGIDQDLSDEQVTRVVAAVQRYVIRVLSVTDNKVKGPMLSIDSVTYRHDPNTDVPMACFLYMVESDYATRLDRKDCKAPPMTSNKYAVIAGIQTVLMDHREFSMKDEESDMDGVVMDGPIAVGQV